MNIDPEDDWTCPHCGMELDDEDNFNAHLDDCEVENA